MSLKVNKEEDDTRSGDLNSLSSNLKPFNDAWWIRAEKDTFPPDDAPILAPYERTQLGFEFLVAETLKGTQDAGCFPVDKDGYQKICLWDIWEREKDPADLDGEKQNINKMQQALGKLSDNDRYIRIQIACFERCYWPFPANADLIIDGIAKGSPNLSAPVSCEPPWRHGILPLLRKRQGYNLDQYPTHHAESISREEQIFSYIKILISWLVEGDLFWLKRRLPDNHSAELAETIYRYLGYPTKLKRLYVQKLCWSLSFWAFSSPSPFEDRRKRWSEITKSLNNNIRMERGGEEEKNTIEDLIDRNDENGSCHHAFFRHIEHIIANIGAGRPVILPSAGEERKRIHNTITNYVHALVSWLAGRTPQEAISIWSSSEETVKRLYNMLGEPTMRKQWLVACLWKRLQENQARRGRGALDEHPQLFACPPDVLHFNT